MERKPNILFLVVDSMRYDAAISKQSETPTMDSLRNRGIEFTSCFSQGISTAPAMTGMLTGRYPLDHSGHWYVEESQPTFAEQYHQAGYETGAIHSNPYVSAQRNFDKGFDWMHENITTFEPVSKRSGLRNMLRKVANRANRILKKVPYTTGQKINQICTDRMASATEPWFIWIQYMDVHGPYLPDEDRSYRAKLRAERLWRKAAVTSPANVTDDEHMELYENYNSEIEYVDNQIGDLLNKLETDGILKNTIVVLTADHGEEFREHGQYGHGNLPYDELIHVPLVIRLPKQLNVPQSKKISTITRGVDIHPTLLDILEVPLTEDMKHYMEGRSVAEKVTGDKELETTTVVTEKRVRDESVLQIGLRTDRWKFIYDGRKNETYLFDLEQDPTETKAVGGRNPEVNQQFKKCLNNRLQQISQTSSDIDSRPVSQQTGVNERLRALGYRE
jgi:arylsulfatase A-like enzyme